MRRSSWMLGLTTLLHLLTGPVVFLLYLSSYNSWTPTNSLNRYQNFFQNLYFPWQLFTMIVCITMCIAIYRYLFSQRMVDLYHSVPIKRDGLFLVKYLHGLLIWLIPFLVNFVIVAALCLLRIMGNPYRSTILPTIAVTIVQAFFLLLVCYFIFYHLFLVAVYISGNVLNMFTNVAIIGLSVVGFWYLFFAFAGKFFETYCYRAPVFMSDLVFSLSPFAAPFGIYSCFCEDVLFSDHLLLLSLSMLFAILSLGLARHMYRTRPSELAERGTLFKRYTTPARIFAAIDLSLAGSLFLCSFTYNEPGQLIWGIFGVLLCAVLSTGFLNSIFHATMKAFFKHKKQLVLVTALSTFFVLVIQLDLFGYDTYLPDKEDIAGIAIYNYALTDNTSGYMLAENGSLTQSTNHDEYVVQEELFTDKELCYTLLSTFIYADTGAVDSTYSDFYTKIQLENGHTYTRYYRLPDSLYEKVAPFIEDKAYKETNYKFSTGALGYPDKLEFSLWDYSISSKLDSDTIKKLLDAYWLDFEEHYTLEELSSYLYIGEISASYYYPNASNARIFSVDIPDNYTRTLAVLSELVPDYLPAIERPADIQEINLYAPDVTNSPDKLQALYEYYGYEKLSDQTPESVTDAYIPDSGTVQVIDTEIVDYIYGPAASATSKRLTLTDAAAIEELYPFLYFGNYRDLFEQDEYVSLGHIITTRGYAIGIYAKPGTLPEKYIEQLYEAGEEY